MPNPLLPGLALNIAHSAENLAADAVTYAQRQTADTEAEFRLSLVQMRDRIRGVLGEGGPDGA